MELSVVLITVRIFSKIIKMDTHSSSSWVTHGVSFCEFKEWSEVYNFLLVSHIKYCIPTHDHATVGLYLTVFQICSIYRKGPHTAGFTQYYKNHLIVLCKRGCAFPIPILCTNLSIALSEQLPTRGVSTCILTEFCSKRMGSEPSPSAVIQHLKLGSMMVCSANNVSREAIKVGAWWPFCSSTQRPWNSHITWD